jgi:hypothetical protein
VLVALEYCAELARKPEVGGILFLLDLGILGILADEGYRLLWTTDMLEAFLFRGLLQRLAVVEHTDGSTSWIYCSLIS